MNEVTCLTVARKCADCGCNRDIKQFIWDIADPRFGLPVDQAGEFVEGGVNKWLCGKCWAKENIGGDERSEA